jgi:hypothetical protein
MPNTPPSAIDAQAASALAKLMLQMEADTQFISQAAQAITNAENQGTFFVVLTTFENCNIMYLQNYLISLGYTISYPQFGNPNISPFNPAQLFGWAWNNYWNNNEIVNQPYRNPVRMKIVWKRAGASPKVEYFIRFVPEYASLSWTQPANFPIPEGTL